MEKRGSCVKKNKPKAKQTKNQGSSPLIYYSNEMVFYHPLDIWKGSMNFFHNIRRQWLFNNLFRIQFKNGLKLFCVERMARIHFLLGRAWNLLMPLADVTIAVRKVTDWKVAQGKLCPKFKKDFCQGLWN